VLVKGGSILAFLTATCGQMCDPWEREREKEKEREREKEKEREREREKLTL